jgi:hypothetical protein
MIASAGPERVQHKAFDTTTAQATWQVRQLDESKSIIIITARAKFFEARQGPASVVRRPLSLLLKPPLLPPLQIKLSNNKKDQPEAKRAVRHVQRAWSRGFTRLLIISRCVSQH